MSSVWQPRDHQCDGTGTAYEGARPRAYIAHFVPAGALSCCDSRRPVECPATSDKPHCVTAG